jgi:hypothetical protein
VFNKDRRYVPHYRPPQLPQIVDHETDSLKPLWEISLEEIARQITLMDWTYFSAISSLPLVHAIKQKNSPCMACENDPFERKVQNITIFRSHLSRLTKMVIGNVLDSNTKEEVTQKVDKFHQLARHLLRMNNLGSCSAIKYALQSVYVTSLKVTTAETTNDWSIFNDLRKYLMTLSPPGIPPIDYYWSKLEKLFANDCSDTNKVDLSFITELNGALQDFEMWLLSPYNFIEPVPWLQEKIRHEENLVDGISLVDRFRRLRQKIT